MKKLSVNLNDEDLAAIEVVTNRNPLAKRHAVVRAAVRAALRQMLRDDAFALECLLEEVAHG